MIWVILALVNLPVFIVLLRVFFKDWDGLKEAIRYFFIPNIISAFKGEFYDDTLAEVKLVIFIFLYVSTVIGEHRLLVWYGYV